MTYTLETLHDAEKKITTCFDSLLSVVNRKKIKDLSDKVLNSNQVKKIDLATAILNLVNVLDSTHGVLKCASVKIENLLADQVEDKKLIIQLQRELNHSKNEEVAAVQSTVKSEIKKSFADIVTSGKSSPVGITTEKIQQAVKSVVNEDKRSRNLVIFGLQEEGPNEKLRTHVSNMMKEFIEDVPCMRDVVRIGAAGSGPRSRRPVKVTFESKESAVLVLSCAKKLRQLSDFKSVYISPDRSAEERVARRRLVSELKEKIVSEPELYHFIQNGKLQSSEKRTTTPPSSDQPTSALETLYTTRRQSMSRLLEVQMARARADCESISP